MALEIYANQPSTTVSSGGTDAPVSGTGQTWTVASSSSFPAASSGATPPTQFHVADASSSASSELIAVTNISGATWTVTRGAEGTTPVAHAAGFTIYQVVSAGAMQQASRTDWLNVVTIFGADPTGAADSTSAIQTALDNAFGGTVYIPEGTYKITSTLNPPVVAGSTEGVCIRGGGWGSVLAFDQSAVSTAIAMGGTTQGKCDIRDLRIEQSGAADGGTAINISYFVNSLIDNVSVDKGATNHANIGIIGASLGTEYNTISNCRMSVAGSGAMGVALTTTAISNSVQDLRVVIQSSGGTGASGVYIDTHSTRLTHVDVEVGPGNGIFLDSLAHATVIDNPYLEGNNIGIKIASGVYCPVVIGGTIETNTIANIQDNGAINPIFTGAWENSGTAVLGNIARLAPTAVKTSGYTAVPGDFVAVSTGSGSPTITLPTAPEDQARIGVKMVVLSGSNTVTIAAGGSDVFNVAAGSTSLTLTRLFQTVIVQYNAAAAIWYVQNTDPAISLDATASDITQVGTALAAGATAKGADAGHVHAHPERIPADGSLIAWSYDPVFATSSFTVVGGVMNLAKMVVRQAQTITNLWVYLTVAVAGATPGQNFLLLYNSTGATLLGNTATTAIDSKITSAGFISQAMGTPYSAGAGTYWIGVLMAGTISAGSIGRASGNSAQGWNLSSGAVSSTSWYAQNGTTGLASSTPPGSVSSFTTPGSGGSICVGCS